MAARYGGTGTVGGDLTVTGGRHSNPGDNGIGKLALAIQRSSAAQLCI